LKQKIVTWASNKVANDGIPMDIGEVEWKSCEGEYDVAAVGWHTQCFNCGGWGHQSRECPSEKKGKGGDKGKGNGSFGNTFGKGGKDFGKGGKDSGKGGKDFGKGGGGKGYQGTCFNSGKVGHKAWECRGDARINANAVEEREDEDDEVQAGSVEIGTVWSIGEVEVNKVDKMDLDEVAKTKAVQITLDSGAGASFLPQNLLKKIPMQAKDKGVRFKAANCTELKYVLRGQERQVQSRRQRRRVRVEVPHDGHHQACGIGVRDHEDGQQGRDRGRPGQVVPRERRDRQADHVEGVRRHVRLRC
jgi:hypothetical protein